MRAAYWRWVKWPEDFNVKLGRGLTEYFLFWIDDQVREETLAARRAGERFDAVDAVYDQYRND
jgi:microcin C transport system substrate-binding protein